MNRKLYSPGESRLVEWFMYEDGMVYPPIEKDKTPRLLLKTEYLGDRTESWILHLDVEGREVNRVNCKNVSWIKFKE